MRPWAVNARSEDLASICLHSNPLRVLPVAQSLSYCTQPETARKHHDN